MLEYDCVGGINYKVTGRVSLFYHSQLTPPLALARKSVTADGLSVKSCSSSECCV